jgi:hypothetical protein
VSLRQLRLQQSYGDPHGWPVLKQQRKSPPSGSPTVFVAQPPIQQSSDVAHWQAPVSHRLPSSALHEGLVELVTHAPPEQEPLQHS